MQDLSDRIIQPRPEVPRRAPRRTGRLHGPRRLGQLVLGALFVVLPLTNGLRLDVRRDTFYFAWHKTAAHDLFLLFWVSMLGVAVGLTVAFLYGRLWCGWACPQTAASDFAESLRKRLDKALRTRPGKPRFRLSRTLWGLGVGATAWASALVLACYWFAPAEVWAAALAPAHDLAPALTVYLTAAALAADMLWLRRRFCTHVCPYGPLLGTVADQNTLAVRYLTERGGECIGCHQCEVDCPMGIDIKQGVGQHGCISCGECVDSCHIVLGRRGTPGLIEFRYGTAPDRNAQALPFWQKLGLWDTRRWAVLSTVPLCLGVVLWLLFGHGPLSASLTASGAVARTPSEVYNGYLLTVASGQPQASTLTLSVTGLPGATVEPQAVRVQPRDSRTLPIVIRVPAGTPPGRTRLRLRVSRGADAQNVTAIFYAPRP